MKRPNKPDAVNPAMASGLNSKYHWRGVTDPERWPLGVSFAFEAQIVCFS